MKLRNKKTGEIVDATMSYREDTAPIVVSETTCDENGQRQGWPYNSLAELNEEWEDVPDKPKKYWWISDRLTIYESEVSDDTIWHINICKGIGNYFETREEAEKAVEKLKAWKRLKDKGFRFKGWNTAFCEIDFDVPDSFYPIDGNMITNETEKDLDLLFGGEE